MISRESYLLAHGKVDQAKAVLHKAINVVMLIALPSVLGLVVVGDKAITVFFGSDFEPATAALFGLLPYVFANPISQLLVASYFVPTNKRGQANWITIVAAVTDTVACLITIPLWGALGAAISLSLAQIVLLSLYAYYSRRFVNWGEVFKTTFIKPFDAALIMGLIVFLSLRMIRTSELLSLIILVVIGVVSYAVSLLIFKEDMTTSYARLTIGKVKYLFKKKKKKEA